MFFSVCTGQENTLLLRSYRDSVSVSGEFVNKVNHSQYYYFLPEILSDKSSVISEIHLMSGFSAFYFNINGIHSFSAGTASCERNADGRLVFNLQKPEEENRFAYTILKEDFNGFYGGLRTGYLVHGLIPFNTEYDLLYLPSSRSDFKKLRPDDISPDSVHIINNNAFLLLSPLAWIQQSENVTIISEIDISPLRTAYIRTLVSDAASIWSKNFSLNPLPDFTVILDRKAGIRSPFLRNGAVLHANLPRKDLAFEILTELSAAMVLEKNPKISQEDLLKTSLALILQYYQATKTEPVKSDLYLKLIGYQEKLDRNLVSEGKRSSRMDREMVILKNFREISTVPGKDRSDFIHFNLTQQFFETDKDKKTGKLIAPAYPGNKARGYLQAVLNPRSGQAGFLPVAGYNVYDGFMAGGLFRWRKHFSVDILPMYSFENNSLNGIYHLKKEFVLDAGSSFRSIVPALSFRNFSFRHFANNPFVLQYRRLAAGMDVHLSSERNRFSGHLEFLRFSYVRINEEFLNVSSNNEFEKENLPFSLLRLKYIKAQERSINPYMFYAGTEYGNYLTPVGRQQYLKLEGSYENAFTYKPGKHIFYRFYLGFFPFNSQENSSNVNTVLTRGSLSIFNRGFSDYGYDELILNRGNEGFLAQQIFGSRGNFRIPAASFFSYGQSNKFLFSANFLLDLPFTGRYFPLKPFIDAAYVMDNTPAGPGENDEFYYTGGLALEWGKHVGLYYPFFYSKQIGIILAENGSTDNTFRNYLSRLSFRIDLMALLKLRDNGPF